MPRLYTNQRINFGSANHSDIPRYQYHRTLRSAIGLSATSYSYQETKNGKQFQWDNIAPEVAFVILQDAEKKGIPIQQEVIKALGSIFVFNDTILSNTLDVLNDNPDYLLFRQKLAVHLTGQSLTKLTLKEVKSAGISTVEEFNQLYRNFLLQQKKLTKNFPNFKKIKESDDYFQLIGFLTSEPLYDKFLKSFTQQLASEFNKNRDVSTMVHPPTEINKNSLLDFFKTISYDLLLKPPGQKLEPNMLYAEIIDSNLRYTVITPSGKRVTDVISSGLLNYVLTAQTSEEELKSLLPTILKIAARRGHTGELALNDTLSLKHKGMDYLAGDPEHDLFLSHLPSLDLVKDEEYKFTLYHWLAQGNLPRLKAHIVNEIYEHYCTALDKFVEEEKNYVHSDNEFAKQIKEMSVVIKDIIALIAALEDETSEKDNELDIKIHQLTEHLKWLKECYATTPLLKPGHTFPSTEGNFDSFIKKLLFNTTSEKVIQYLSDPQDESKTWKLNLMEVIHGLINEKSSVMVKDISDKTTTILVDDKELSIAPARVLRDQLKTYISVQLKINAHSYYASRSYQNDNLTLRQAALSFRGGYLSDSLAETKQFAKKMTRGGEITADSHLLVGQENNIKKHEVRSATAANVFAATGADGTRSATEKYSIAMQFGGDKDVKIMYILRGKEAFHVHSYLDPLGKNKFSEIAYTHVKPSDYVMTILYDKNNVILDVIPGNLADDIQGISTFTEKVLSAAIEFYNMKHNPDYKATITLPVPEVELTLTTPKQPSKSLLEILQSHAQTSTEKTKSTQQSGSIRIRRSLTNKGHKALILDNLSKQVTLHFKESIDDILPSASFTYQPGKLAEVKAEAVKHYHMRHVLTLKDFNSWSDHERKLQLEHNRILQPGFMIDDVQVQLMHAKIAKAEWLTDVLVPRITTAFLLNIAARLITDYRIDVEEVNKFSQQLYNDIWGGQYACEFTDIEVEISQALNRLSESGHYRRCVENAKIRMTKIYPYLEEGSHDYQHCYTSCLEIEKNKVRKALTNLAISKFLDKYLDTHAKFYKLEKKPVYSIAENRDFVFLGAAASGKSTISSQYVNSEAKKDYVSLATDDYRSICLPYTETFESQKNDQIFIRTQDTAFLISELVEERLKSQSSTRPNVIVDGVTYKPFHQELVGKNNNSLIVCACLDDISQVVKRSYERAKQDDASSADKGRYVNTTSLINMHKTASLNLLKLCAPNSTIALYDTNIPRGTKPPLIATVDTHNERKIIISNEKGALTRLASFFNKSRVNVNAKSDDSLFFKKLKKAEFQIDSLFAALDLGYKIMLSGEKNIPFLIVSKKVNNTIHLNITDIKQLTLKIQESTGPEKQLLQMLVLYGHYGSLKEVHKQCLLHDNDLDLLTHKFFTSLPESQGLTNTTDFSSVK
ncbi:hypothetical protein [Legionella hackeliae]|uniref:Uncharacterized protein n=1 Tax=Legionella hackeliae TaxID=449 RepID=A0A0A8UWR7_LEGHA|nr:hypothetical protein [Legionella hackeliae]KTD13142.1 coiled-coil protein [Legionella hackeliae]CEK11547.1 conserved protein of unknown function [Zeta_toxin] [Legionella hackeliae]STX48318.1 coiled-coil protein [Legionella hackeliae]